MAIVDLDGFETGATLAPTVTATSAITIGTGRDGLGIAIRCGSGGDYQTRVIAPGSDTVFFHTATLIQPNSFNRTDDGNCFFTLLTDGGTVAHLAANFNTSGQITLRRGSGASTIIATSANAFPTGVSAWHSFEVKALIHDTLGECVIKVDGVEWLNFAGDTRGAGASTRPDRIRLGMGNPGNQFVDDFLLCDTTGAVNNSWPGEVSIVALRPNGNGANSGLLGSDANSVDNYLLVDENPINSTDYAGSPTVGALDTYAMGNVGKTGTVLGLRAFAYAAKSDAGAKSFKFVVRSSTGTLAKSADIPLSTSYALYAGVIRETDPNGAAWTVASVDAAEVGFEVGA